MSFQGFDCVFDASKCIPQIKANNFSWVGRYYFKSSRYKVPLTKTEVTALNAAGISVVTVFEGAGDVADSFSLDAGMQDAATALQCAEVAGQPQGSPIYFAVDFDASPDEIDNRVDQYFRGVGKVLAGKYKVGAYGSGLVLGALAARGLITHQWLSGAMGWRSSRGYAAMQIAQGPQTNLGFGSIDPNVAQGDYGGWRLDADQTVEALPVEPAPEPAPIRTDDNPIATAIGSLQGALKDGGFYAGSIDGIYGPQSAAAMLAYNRSL